MREAIRRLVFLDETGTTTKMTRLRGRARRGARLKADAAFGQFLTDLFSFDFREILIQFWIGLGSLWVAGGVLRYWHLSTEKSSTRPEADGFKGFSTLQRCLEVPRFYLSLYMLYYNLY